MARTTPAQVRGVVRVADAVTDLQVSEFIDIATSLVDKVCLSSGYGAEQLEKIERYLAAHFYALYRPRPAQENAGAVGEQKEQIKVDLGLRVTKYGQTAMLLDTAGNLARLQNSQDDAVGKPQKRKIVWLGTGC